MDDKTYLYDLLVHDLRGPLSVVAATVGSLLTRMESYGPLTELQQNSLLRIQRNAKKAQTILNEIIDVEKSIENIFVGNTIAFDELVKESIVNAIEFSQGSIDDKIRNANVSDAFKAFLNTFAIDIEISGKYAKNHFYHDKRKIQLIIENLVSNAMKYRRNTLKVKIGGEKDVVITVSDDGAGIPVKEANSIYGRFSQCSNADLPQIKGLGLGLFCVKSLVESMGGTIDLNSCEETGTVFVVQIPPLKK
jgi:signal transduction histidine kinase